MGQSEFCPVKSAALVCVLRGWGGETDSTQQKSKHRHINYYGDTGKALSKVQVGDFPGSPVVKTLPSNPGGVELRSTSWPQGQKSRT